MNDFTTLLIATGRMEDRLREAERDRLAKLVKAAARPASGRLSLWARLRRFRGTAKPITAPSTVVRPC